MDAEERLSSGRDYGVIQEDEGLDQLADIGGADEARDGPVPATAGDKRDPTRTSAHCCFECVLDVEAKGWPGDDCCSCGVHFHLHKRAMSTR